MKLDEALKYFYEGKTISARNSSHYDNVYMNKDKYCSANLTSIDFIRDDWYVVVDDNELAKQSNCLEDDLLDFELSLIDTQRKKIKDLKEIIDIKNREETRFSNRIKELEQCIASWKSNFYKAESQAAKIVNEQEETIEQLKCQVKSMTDKNQMLTDVLSNKEKTKETFEKRFEKLLFEKDYYKDMVKKWLGNYEFKD